MPEEQKRSILWQMWANETALLSSYGKYIKNYNLVQNITNMIKTTCLTVMFI